MPHAPVETLNSMISDLASFIKSRPRLGQEPSRQEAGGEGPLPFPGRGVAADGARSGQGVSQCKDSSYAIGDAVQTPSKGVAFSVLSEAPSGGEGLGGVDDRSAYGMHSMSQSLHTPRAGEAGDKKKGNVLAEYEHLKGCVQTVRGVCWRARSCPRFVDASLLRRLLALIMSHTGEQRCSN